MFTYKFNQQVQPKYKSVSENSKYFVWEPFLKRRGKLAGEKLRRKKEIN